MINIYAPNNRATKYMKKLTESKRKYRLFGNRKFNILLSKTDTRQKINKKIEDLNNNINYVDVRLIQIQPLHIQRRQRLLGQQLRAGQRTKHSPGCACPQGHFPLLPWALSAPSAILMDIICPLCLRTWLVRSSRMLASQHILFSSAREDSCSPR